METSYKVEGRLIRNDRVIPWRWEAKSMEELREIVEKEKEKAKFHGYELIIDNCYKITIEEIKW